MDDETQLPARATNTDENAAQPVVLFAPGAMFNPYHQMLAGGLAAAGWRVESCALSATRVLRALRHHRPRVLHLHWLNIRRQSGGRIRALYAVLTLALTLWLARLCGLRIVWTIHNLYEHEPRHFDRLARRLISRLAHARITHTRAAIDAAHAAFVPTRAPITHIPLGNYSGWYPEPPDQPESRRRLGLPADEFVFLFVGLIRRYKGVEDLLAAFRQLPAEQPCRLVIAGEPYDPAIAATLRSLAAEDPRVDLRPGFVADDDLPTLLSACNVVALPYRTATTSAAAMLAMSFARPCIAPDIPCFSELVTPTGDLLYPAGDISALRDAMARAISNAEQLPELGRQQLATAQQHDWSDIARRHAALYAG